MKKMCKYLPPVITIDGPSGSGKGTVSKILAEKLSWYYLDSGAIYRVLAYAVRNFYLDENLVSRKTLDFSLSFEKEKIYYEGEEVSVQIRYPEIAKIASVIAGYPLVRSNLLELQRSFRKMPGLIADGRDMGTVVFTDAKLKFYLDATLEERVKRRKIQLQDKEVSVNVQQLREELFNRDLQDATRKIAPLQVGAGAVVIDTTKLTIDEVLQRILLYVKDVLN